MSEYASEAEHWQAWKRGETRCPYCVGLQMDDFEAICDCSRFSLETTGRPIVISVIGHPETATTVIPHTIVRWFCHDCGGPRTIEDFPFPCERCGSRVIVSSGAKRP